MRTSLAIMNLSRGNIFGVLGVPYEQEVITNQAMIPVMLMNPRESPPPAAVGASNRKGYLEGR
jgi:hypothetical protein